MARDDQQVNFRIPIELLERLRRAAGAGNRSVTAELVNRLQRTLDEDDLFAEESQIHPDDLVASMDPDAELTLTLAHLGALSEQMREVSKKLRHQAAQITGLRTIGADELIESLDSEKREKAK